MRKILLTAVALCYCSIMMAQDPALFDKTWYLVEMYAEFVDPTEVSDVEPSIMPIMEFDQSLGFSGFVACSDFDGQFTYLGGEIYRLEEFNMLPGGCSFQSHTEFEITFSSYFFPSSEIKFFLYEIDGVEYLDLNVHPGVGVFYQSIPLSTEQFHLNNIEFSPNPTKDVIYLNGMDQLDGRYEVHDLTGQLISQGDLQPSIDLENQATGLYFVTIISGSAQRVIKVVRQ